MQRRALRLVIPTVVALATIFCIETHAAICFEISGTADLTVSGVFQPNHDFTVEFCGDEPAIDAISDPTRGLFVGTATLTLVDPAFMGGLESTNVNALRQDQNPEGLFLVNDSNAFNNATSAVFTQGGVIADANVLAPLPLPPSVHPATSNGGGLIWQFANGTTVQFNQASNLTVANSVVPEPSSTIPLLFGIALLAMRRK